MNKVTLTCYDNDAANWKTLIKGEDYVVIYKDCHTGKRRYAGAKWDGRDFMYCDGKFVCPSVKPRMVHDNGRIPGYHYILGWVRLSEQEGE